MGIFSSVNRKVKTIITAGLLAGTLDILSAFIHYFVNTGKTNFTIIFKFIATGLFGRDALAGGRKMILTGFVLHYLIAFLFTLFFFCLFPKVKVASANRLVTAILYGIFVWCVMNLIIVPISRVPHQPFSISNALINIGILIVCIGVPLSWIANKYYRVP
jgi:hypothetical protein